MKICECGCGRPVANRFYLGHNPDFATRKAGRTARTRSQLWAYMLTKRRILPNGCWEWLGAKDKDGYGFTCYGKQVRVTRIAAVLHCGLSLSDSHAFVCHHCDMPSCFNPDHLFLGTAKSNMHDAMSKDRRLLSRDNKGRFVIKGQ